MLFFRASATRQGQFAGLTLLFAAATGCGSDLAEVYGRVTLDGEPLAGSRELRGTVLLHPVDGGPAGTGTIDGDGQYTVVMGTQEGVPPGQYLATVTATQIILPTHPEGTPSGRLLAKKAGIPLDVAAGSNEFDIELQTGE